MSLSLSQSSWNPWADSDQPSCRVHSPHADKKPSVQPFPRFLAFVWHGLCHQSHSQRTGETPFFFPYPMPHITTNHNGPLANVFMVPSSVDRQLNFTNNISRGIICPVPHLLVVHHFPLLVVLQDVPYQVFLFFSPFFPYCPAWQPVLFLLPHTSHCFSSSPLLPPSSWPHTSAITVVLLKMSLAPSASPLLKASPAWMWSFSVAGLGLWVGRKDPSPMLLSQ